MSWFCLTIRIGRTVFIYNAMCVFVNKVNTASKVSGFAESNCDIFASHRIKCACELPRCLY